MSVGAFPLDGVTYAAKDHGAWLMTRTRGVFSSDHYSVTPATGMNVSVSPGIAWLLYGSQWGISVYSDTAVALAVDQTTLGYTRIDAVIVGINKSTKVASVSLRKGTPATTGAVPPAIVRTTAADEIAVAYITVTYGTTVITASHLTDKRLDETVCGLMRDGVTGIPTANLQAQAQALIDQLRADVAAAETGDYLLTSVYDSTGAIATAGGLKAWQNAVAVSLTFESGVAASANIFQCYKKDRTLFILGELTITASKSASAKIFHIPATASPIGLFYTIGMKNETAVLLSMSWDTTFCLRLAGAATLASGDKLTLNIACPMAN